MKQIVKAALDVLFPFDFACPFCASEKPQEQNACAGCSSLLKPLGSIDRGKVCDEYYAQFEYDAPASTAIQNLKFENKPYLYKQLAAIAQIPEHWLNNCCIMPVPLSKQRRKHRGYNQSALLAGEIAAKYSVKYDDSSLFRQRNTISQTTLGIEQRRVNLKDAFCANDIKCGKIVLIDDVITSGSTVNECATALREAGVQKVYAFAICATVIKEKD